VSQKGWSLKQLALFFLITIIFAVVVFTVGFKIGRSSVVPIKVAISPKPTASVSPQPSISPEPLTYCSNSNCGTISIPKD
jgi:hypothetical protein